MGEIDREELYLALNDNESVNESVPDEFELPVEPIHHFILEENINAYKLLRNISLLHEHFEKGVPVFSPKIVFTNGARSFAEEDLCEDDYNLLLELDLDRLPLALHVKIADLLWKNKKNYKMAKFAVAAWHQMYLDTCDTEHWYTCIEYIRRSITLAQKIGDKQSSQTYLDELFSKLVEINGNGDPYFSICATKFLVEQKYNNLEPILTVMDNILEKETNIMTVNNLYKIKKGILLILKDDNGLRKNYIEHAQFLESQSNISPENKIQDLMKADSLLKEAVVLYRNAGESQSAEQAHNRLLAIQSELSNEMPITTDTFDVTNFYNHVKTNFENLTFEEHIFMLAYLCPFFSKAEMKKSVSSPGRFLSRRYFEKQKMDSQGRTVCITPALNENSTKRIGKKMNTLSYSKIRNYMDQRLYDGELNF